MAPEHYQRLMHPCSCQTLAKEFDFCFSKRGITAADPFSAWNKEVLKGDHIPNALLGIGTRIAHKQLDNRLLGFAGAISVNRVHFLRGVRIEGVRSDQWVLSVASAASSSERLRKTEYIIKVQRPMKYWRDTSYFVPRNDASGQVFDESFKTYQQIGSQASLFRPKQSGVIELKCGCWDERSWECHLYLKRDGTKADELECMDPSDFAEDFLWRETLDLEG